MSRVKDDHLLKPVEAAVQLISEFEEDRLLTPQEAAELFGVRTTTITRWVRKGRLPALVTPGGHRRYQLRHVRALLDRTKQTETGMDRRTARDTVRLYGQRRSVRQVAEKFDIDHNAMRHLLQRNGVCLRQ